MILLDATTKSLEIILGGAVATNQLPWTVHYVDVNQSTFVASAASESDGATNSGTAVTMAAAPASGVTRQIKAITVVNADTGAVTVTIRINNNGTFRNLFVGTLSVGDNLCYSD